MPLALIARATVTVTVEPTNNTPTIDVSALSNPTDPNVPVLIVAEDSPTGLKLADFAGPDPWIIIADVDDVPSATTPILEQVTLTVQHGGLTIADDGLTLIGRVEATGVLQPRAAVTAYQTLIYQGTIAQLNAALQTVKYYPAADFNTPPVFSPSAQQTETLTVTVNDLGNVDYRSASYPDVSTNPNDPRARTATQTLTLTVEPTNDVPTINVPIALNLLTTEDEATGLPLLDTTDPRNPVSITIADLDESTWPAPLLEQLTLTVLHGGLTMTTTGLTAVNEVLATNVAQPLAYQTMTYYGTIAQLNAALATLTYFGSTDFNTAGATDGETLMLSVDDMGNVDYQTPGYPSTMSIDPLAATALTATKLLTLTVQPTNDAPQINTSALPPPRIVAEDNPAGLSLAGIAVADVDQTSTSGPLMEQITLLVQHGALSLTPYGSMTVPVSSPWVPTSGDAVPDTSVWDPAVLGPSYQSLTYLGTIDDINAALATLHYYSGANYNSGKNVETLTVLVNDLGNVDYQTYGYPAVNIDPTTELAPPDGQALTTTQVLTLTVNPTNDAPQIDASKVTTTTNPTAPTYTLDEDSTAGLAFNGIAITDVDQANSASTIIEQLTLTVRHGALTMTKIGTMTPITASWVQTTGDAVPATSVLSGVSYQSITYQGTLADLTAGLKTLKYYGGANFNTTGGQTEGLVITVNDLGNVDYRTLGPVAYPGVSTNPNDPQALTALPVTLPLTVRAINDTPKIEVSELRTTTTPAAPLLNVDEDSQAGLAFTGIVVSDADQVAPANLVEQFTLTVQHGGLTLDASNLTLISQTLTSGLTLPDASLGLGNTYQTMTYSGTLSAINTALGTLKYYAGKDFNTGKQGETLTIQVNDLGNVDWRTTTPGPSVGTALKANQTLTITVRPTNDAPAISVSALQTTTDDPLAPTLTVNEDSTLGLAFTGITLSDLDQTNSSATIWEQVGLTVLHGGLTLGTTKNLLFVQQVPASAAGTAPLPPNDATTYQSLLFRGTIADINTALATLTYYPAADFNTGKDSETLIMRVNDMGNVDYRTLVYPSVNVDPTKDNGQTKGADATLTLTIRPTNDSPKITVPTGLQLTMDENAATGMRFQNSSSQTLSVADVDDLNSPTEIQEQVTVTVQHGGVTMDVAGLGLTQVAAQTILASADGVQPAASGTYQQLTYRGTIAHLNTALASLTYYPDVDFNTTTKSEVLTLQVNDLGNVDYRTPGYPTTISTDPSATTALTAIQALTLTVQPKNSAPVIHVPTGFDRLTVIENASAGLPLIASGGVLTVSDVDDPTGTIPEQVTLTVQHGGLRLATSTGLTMVQQVPADFDSISPLPPNSTTYQTLVFWGKITDLNTALSRLTYYPDAAFYSGKLSETLLVEVNDMGNVDYLTPGYPASSTNPSVSLAKKATQSFTLTVQPVNDAPAVDITNLSTTTTPTAPLLTVNEDSATGLAFSGLLLKDADDPYAVAPILEQMTLTVLHGGMTITDTGLTLIARAQTTGDAVPSAAVLTGPSYQTMTYRGTLVDLNAALATLRYYGGANFNTGKLSETLTVGVNDLGNVDFNTLGYPAVSTDPNATTKLTASQTLTLTVRPTNDKPAITVPNGIKLTVKEDSPPGPGQLQVPIGLLLVNPSGQGLTVSDLDETNSPALLLVQVTVGVSHGGLLLGTTTGTIIDATNSVLANADGKAPLAPYNANTYQTLIFRGKLTDINAALATLTYYADTDFNTGIAAENLTVSVNDLGNVDYATSGYPAISTNPNASTAQTASQTLALTVTPSNDPPYVANPIADRTVAGGSVTVVDLTGVFNDPDIPNGDFLTLSYSNSSDNTNPGLVTGVLVGNQLTLTVIGQAGSAFLTVHATDSTALTAVATFTLRVQSPPVAVNDSASTLENRPVTISVLANDRATGGSLTASTVAIVAGFGPLHGTVSISNGVVTYTPSVGFPGDPTTSPPATNPNSPLTGTDSFRYTVQDSSGMVSNQATVTVTVTEVADYQNPIATLREDVNNDGQVSPIDALIVINYVNVNSDQALPPDPVPPTKPASYWDVTGDNRVNSSDVLQVVVRLNKQSLPAGEGEDAAATSVISLAAVTPATATETSPLLAPNGGLPAAIPASQSVLVGPLTSTPSALVRADLPATPWGSTTAEAASSPSTTASPASLFDILGAGEGRLAETGLDDVLTDIAGDVHAAQDGQIAEDWVLGGLLPQR